MKGAHVVIRTRTDTTLFIEVTCPMCQDVTDVAASWPGYEAWMRGAYIQDALPQTSPEQREALLTGYCSGCQQEIFGTEDCG